MGLHTSDIYADMASRGIYHAIDPIPALTPGSRDCVRECLAALQRMADDAERAAARDETRIPDAPDWSVTQRPGYRESLAADGIELVPAETIHEPWIEEPTDAEWDRLEIASRDYPPSGGLD